MRRSTSAAATSRTARGRARSYPNGVANFISKQSYGPKWLWTPNGISQSVVGIKVSQPIAYGWSLVGTVETGFSPYSWNLANGQRSQAQNNGLALAAARRQRRFGPQRPMGQFAGLRRDQQQDLWHAGRRPRQHAGAGRTCRLRSDGQRLRLLAIRLFRLLRRLRRHRDDPVEHRDQIPRRLHEFPRQRSWPDRKLQPGQRFDLDVPGQASAQTSPISLPAWLSRAPSRSTRSAPMPRTR